AAGTQNQALAALLFLYREVLEQKLPWLDHFKPGWAGSLASADQSRLKPLLQKNRFLRCALSCILECGAAGDSGPSRLKPRPGSPQDPIVLRLRERQSV